MSEGYLSVTQINTYIKNIFEAEVMLQNICVYGEVGSFKITNGIAYFNLLDKSGMLNCVLFGADKFATPSIGDMVLVQGSISYYAKGGKLSFNAYSIMPYGKGMLYEKFLQLKNKLQMLGYFDEARKKSLPSKVRRIGVVSSKTGAVIHDIIDVTHRRNNSIDIVLYPVKVQGVGAEFEIASGIDFFSSYDDVDVIIVARGGGSLEDLEPFNTEVVANAVFRCEKPLVSAVGHETDFTIIDFVADLRAPTPSAAAEIVAWDKNLEIDRIDDYMYTISSRIKNIIKSKNKDIDLIDATIRHKSTLKFNAFVSKLSDIVGKLAKFNIVVDRLSNATDVLSSKIEAKNPRKLASFGYSKIMQNNKIVNSIANIDKDEKIVISMIDGNINTKVID